MRVLVFGTFDGLHQGHLFLLKEARKRGELSVVVARDSNVKRIKGRRPRHNQKKRLAAVQAAFPESCVILGDPRDFLAPVRALSPDHILLGYDQKLPPNVYKEDIPCPVTRLPAWRPDAYKSSILHQKMKNKPKTKT